MPVTSLSTENTSSYCLVNTANNRHVTFKNFPHAVLMQHTATLCRKLLCISEGLIPVTVSSFSLVCFSLITGVSALLFTQDTTEIRSTDTSVTSRACRTTQSLCTPSTKGSKGHFLTKRSSSIWNFMPTEGLSVLSRHLIE